MADSIQWEILEDGTVSIMTDAVSGQNHVSADQLLENLADMLGGSVDVKHRKGHVHKHRGKEVSHSHKH